MKSTKRLKPSLHPLIPLSTPQTGAAGKTGFWRHHKPLLDASKCNGCGLCIVYCPDSVIQLNKNGKATILYDYCKGCGICEVECPLNAITMVEEER
ncbi:MAG: 4Fe-4S dicluster domain-containing protein [Nitrososphaeria archaeon]|nr:4Fe-4S dicluster domain-containing protein [Nitrososphaeria archaeon]NIN53412.1 4Fe-4S dicluster domain-containing protein [Nitrososphaeria archaeon]NIQ33924.1 4Fe-4S dicluster domain-containing protein [Nitrososphaeria archaeon]